jgi:hypothetical protein
MDATEHCTSPDQLPSEGNGESSSSVLSAHALDPSPDADVEEDEVFGLVSVLYHALRSASASRKYMADARDADDPELQQFFGRCRAMDAARAEEAKQLLASRVTEARRAETVGEAAFAASDGANDAAVSPGEDGAKSAYGQRHE